MVINAAGILIQNKKGEILVLHRKDFVPEGNKWGLPGGKVAEDKEPIEAAKEKTLQEIALKFKKEDLRHLGEFNFIDDLGNDIFYNTWMAKLPKGESNEIKLNTDGHDGYEWKRPNNLLRQKNLMKGMYPILEKYLQLKQDL